MKYIMEDKYIIKCEHYYYVTHGGDCCSDDKPICKGRPCNLKLNKTKFYIPHYNIIEPDELGTELISKIDHNDLAWASQNLQSDNWQKKIVSKYLLDNN